MDGFTGFSIIPLRASSVLGFVMAVLGFLSGIIIIIRKLVNPQIAAGYTSLISVVLICSGVILLMMGMLGEYVGRIFMNLNHLPQYVIKNQVNTEHIEDDTQFISTEA